MKPSKCPPREELHDLYIGQQQSTRTIGQRYGVKHISVRRWLESYKIPIRPSGRGLANRGIEPPSREELVQMVHTEHLSYPEIAKKYGVDSSAIRHWLIKHDIERPKIWDTRSKGQFPEIDPGVVREKYLSGLSLEAIGQEYGVSHGTIKRVCVNHGIDVRPPGFTGELYPCENGLMVRSTYEQRVVEWLSDHSIPFVYEPKYPFGKNLKADFNANGWFIEVWGVEGSEIYEEKKVKKIRLCEIHGIPLIEIKRYYFSKTQSHLLDKALSKTLVEPTVQGFLF